MSEQNENSLGNNPLTPRPKEQNLWKTLEQADTPVVNILKRVNRIFSREFPGTNMSTCSSCSGHIQEGHAEDTSPTMNKKNKPHLWIAAPDETTTAEQRDRMKEMLGIVFRNAVEKANAIVDESCLELDEFTTEHPKYFCINRVCYANEYLHRLTLKFGQRENFKAIQTFWSAIEKELTSLDGLSIVTTTSPQDFLQK